MSTKEQNPVFPYHSADGLGALQKHQTPVLSFQQVTTRALGTKKE